MLSNKQVRELFEKIYAGYYAANGRLPVELYQYTANELIDALNSGFKQFSINSPAYDLHRHLERNLYVFSGAKTYQNVKDL